MGDSQKNEVFCVEYICDYQLDHLHLEIEYKLFDNDFAHIKLCRHKHNIPSRNIFDTTINKLISILVENLFET